MKTTYRSPTSVAMAGALATLSLLAGCGGATMPPPPRVASAAPPPRAAAPSAPPPVVCYNYSEDCATPEQQAARARVEAIRDQLMAGEVERESGCIDAARQCVPNTSGCPAGLMQELAFSAGCIDEMLPLFPRGPLFAEEVRREMCNRLGGWIDATTFGVGTAELPSATPDEAFALCDTTHERLEPHTNVALSRAVTHFRESLECLDYVNPRGYQLLTSCNVMDLGEFDVRDYASYELPFRAMRFRHRVLLCTTGATDVRRVDACFAEEIRRADVELHIDGPSLAWLRSVVTARRAEFVRPPRSRPTRGEGGY